jgi:L-ascorbate metabolism protein UlaG (beta-lactamase superfamily)
MRVWLGIAVAVATAPLPGGAPAHDGASARYLGNEGVLVARGDTKILFDAFYAESFDGEYSLVRESDETAMMTGQAPFDGIDAIFISHIHPDHFNSRKTIAYMRANPAVRLYAGIDVVGAIRAADASSDPLMKRVVPVHVVPGAPPQRFSIDGLEIEAFPIPHNGGGPTPNYAFRVALDGQTRIFHLGDADPADRHYAPYQGEFDAHPTDVAFPPYWMLLDSAGKRVLEQRIRPREVIAIHAGSEVRADPDRARRETGADLFVEPGEERPIPERER